MPVIFSTNCAVDVVPEKMSVRDSIEFQFACPHNGTNGGHFDERLVLEGYTNGEPTRTFMFFYFFIVGIWQFPVYGLKSS